MVISKIKMLDTVQSNPQRLVGKQRHSSTSNWMEDANLWNAVRIILNNNKSELSIGVQDKVQTVCVVEKPQSTNEL